MAVNTRLEQFINGIAVQVYNEQSCLLMEQRMRKAYQAAITDIQKKLDDFYEKYAKDNKISLQEAKLKLNAKDTQSVQNIAEEYRKLLNRKRIGRGTQQKLKEIVSKTKATRYDELLVNCVEQLAKVGVEANDEMDDTASLMYKDAFGHTMFNTQKTLGMGVNFNLPSERLIRVASNIEWLGSTFKERTGYTLDAVTNNIETIMTEAFIQGKNPDKLGKLLARQFNMSENACKRDMRTLTTMITNQASVMAYKNCELVEEYEFVATLDGKTSDKCRAMDGKRFKIIEAVAFVNLPPLHYNCRSTTIPYFDDLDEFSASDRIARDESGKSYFVGEDVTYKDWVTSHARGLYARNDKTDWNYTPEKVIANEVIIEERQKLKKLQEERVVYDAAELTSGNIDLSVYSDEQLDKIKAYLRTLKFKWYNNVFKSANKYVAAHDLNLKALFKIVVGDFLSVKGKYSQMYGVLHEYFEDLVEGNLLNSEIIEDIKSDMNFSKFYMRGLKIDISIFLNNVIGLFPVDDAFGEDIKKRYLMQQQKAVNWFIDELKRYDAGDENAFKIDTDSLGRFIDDDLKDKHIQFDVGHLIKSYHKMLAMSNTNNTNSWLKTMLMNDKELCEYLKNGDERYLSRFIELFNGYKFNEKTLILDTLINSKFVDEANVYKVKNNDGTTFRVSKLLEQHKYDSSSHYFDDITSAELISINKQGYKALHELITGSTQSFDKIIKDDLIALGKNKTDNSKSEEIAIKKFSDDILGLRKKLQDSDLNGNNGLNFTRADFDFLFNSVNDGASFLLSTTAPQILNASSKYQRFVTTMGLNEKPTTVSRDEFDKMLKDSEYPEMFRAVKNAGDTGEAFDVKGIREQRGKYIRRAIMNDLLYGEKQFIGNGIYGDGLYFSTKPTHDSYGGFKGTKDEAIERKFMVRAAIKPGTKVIAYDDIPKLAEKLGLSGFDEAVVARIAGYKVIKAGRVKGLGSANAEEYYNIIDRSCLVIEDVDKKSHDKAKDKSTKRLNEEDVQQIERKDSINWDEAKKQAEKIFKYYKQTNDAVKEQEKKQLEKEAVSENNQKYYKQVMHDIFERNDFAMSMDGNILDIIADSWFMNQLESGRAPLGLTRNRRMNLSEKMFGIQRNADFGDFEKYGYLASKNPKDDFKYNEQFTGGYGNTVVRFKKKNLLSRTTFTIGDSLYNFEQGWVTASPVVDPSIASIKQGDVNKSIYGLSVCENANQLKDTISIQGSLQQKYIELQYHGKITIDDVESVTINAGSENPSNKVDINSEHMQKIIKMLKEKGIKVYYVDSKTEEIQQL